MERYFALREVAAATSTSVAVWRKLVSRRAVRAVHIGRSVRVPESEISRFLGRTETSGRSVGLKPERV
jgi:predicted DNA-binding transcriptional regulator AlpA